MIESSCSPSEGGGNDGFFPSDLNPCSPQYPVLKVLARPRRGRRLSARRRSRKKVIYSPSPPPSRVFSGKSGIFFGRARQGAASGESFACSDTQYATLLAIDKTLLNNDTQGHMALGIVRCALAKERGHQSSRRVSIARPSVTSSANSRSPPTGRPLASRETLTPSGLINRAK